jgi:hypothetical protein
MADETRYDIGAERTKELHSNAIVPGRLLRPPGEIVPSGPTHAVDRSTGQTLCGAQVRKVFDSIDWRSASMVEKCPRCRDLAEPLPSSSE